MNFEEAKRKAESVFEELGGGFALVEASDLSNMEELLEAIDSALCLLQVSEYQLEEIKRSADELIGARVLGDLIRPKCP